jgi:adenylate cyclase
VPYVHATTAEVLSREGAHDEALALLDEAFALAASTGERFYEAEIHRLRAAVLLARDPEARDEAVGALRQAVAIAHEQGALPFAERATTALAGLLGQTDR